MIVKFDFYNSIKNVINSLYIDNKIDHETILIIPVFKKGIEDILRVNANFINKFILISKDKIDINELNDKIEIIYIPNNFKNEELLLMAKDIKEEYDNSYILDLSSNFIYEQEVAKNFSKELVVKYNNIEKIFVPYVYGGLYMATYKIFKLMTDSKVVLINYLDENIKEEIDYDMIVDSDFLIKDNDNVIIII